MYLRIDETQIILGKSVFHYTVALRLHLTL